ncbi:hypothetical protein [Streptomyces venezuelae]
MTSKTMHKTEADLRATLTTLADRYEEIADHADGYRRAATDIREVLRTGRVPHWWMTDVELEEHGTPEEAAS